MLADIFGVDGVIVLIVVVVLLFGGAAIPKLARNLGSAKTEFEKGLNEGKKASDTPNLDGEQRHLGGGRHAGPARRRRRPTIPSRGPDPARRADVRPAHAAVLLLRLFLRGSIVSPPWTRH